MRISLSCILFLLSCFHCYGSVHLIQGGKCMHKIVLNSGASPSEEHSASELQEHLKLCTGIELPIIKGFPQDDTPMIVIGCGEVSKNLGIDPPADELGEQGCLIQTVGENIVIAGSRQAGTLYGVHRFLEKYLGVRWYAPGVTKTPKINDLIIAETKSMIKPAFLYRHTSYRLPGSDADFITRLGQNAGNGDANSQHGIQYQFLGTCHSYFSYISPDEFFDKHPEYFSEIGGIRRREETQLCLTNPDVLEIVTQRMIEAMSKYPSVRQFNFSQMDYYNYCECPKCSAVNEKYGTLGGTQFWFVNELAKRTSKVYPDKLISTLAYMYTEEPPKNLKMHPNVAVWLCHMYPSCDSHPVATCPLNADYKRRAIEWSKICSHLYVWHYIADFAHYYVPFPNFRALSEDLRFYRDIGVEGLYLQGMSHEGGGGEFSLLRPYYVMKLAWGPDQNPDEIIKDFLEGYYGPAWNPIWEYITLLHNKVENENIHMHLYTNPAQGYLTDDIIEKSTELFNSAENSVKDNEEFLERVRVARMPLVYAKMFPRNGYKIENGKLTFVDELVSLDVIMDFIARMKRHGFVNLREMSYLSGPDELLLLYSFLTSSLDVITIGNEYLSVDVVPALAARVLRIIDRSSGECITAYNVKKSLTFPFCGGLDDRVGGLFEPQGWIGFADITERTPNSLTSTMQIGKFRLERKLELPPKEPILRIISTLTNTDRKPTKAHPRSHLELDLGELRSNRVKFTSKSGKAVDKDMTNIIAGLREGEYYRMGNTPDGEWIFTGNKGFQVIQRFDKEQIDFTQLYAYPENLGELEVELWIKPKVLSEGQSITFKQEIEVQLIQ